MKTTTLKEVRFPSVTGLYPEDLGELKEILSKPISQYGDSGEYKGLYNYHSYYSIFENFARDCMIVNLFGYQIDLKRADENLLARTYLLFEVKDLVAKYFGKLTIYILPPDPEKDSKKLRVRVHTFFANSQTSLKEFVLAFSFGTTTQQDRFKNKRYAMFEADEDDLNDSISRVFGEELLGKTAKDLVEFDFLVFMSKVDETLE